MNFLLRATGALGAVLLAAATIATYKSTTSFQMGNAGVGMEIVETKERISEKLAENVIPPALPAASKDGKLAVDAYKNVQVLGHLSSGEFTRLMTAITIWVAPNNGCAYCHAPQRDASGHIVKDDEGNPQADLNNMQSDELYTKRVARRMLQMTMHVNADWKQHVKNTGVTCYTCHRGNPVPKNIWFDQPGSATRYQGLGNEPFENGPSTVAGLSSLPRSPYEPYLDGEEEIRVQATEAIGSADRSSIKQAEWTYGLMISMSEGLGVNCTYCHNSRSFGDWSTSPDKRGTAWYGIRLARDLNKNYLDPLASTFPAVRLGPIGDGPKVNCATCHAGAYKPLLGVSMLKEYPELAEAKPQPEKTPVAPATDPGTAPAAGSAAPAGSVAPAGSAGSLGFSNQPVPAQGVPAPVTVIVTTGVPAAASSSVVRLNPAPQPPKATSPGSSAPSAVPSAKP